MTKTTFAFGAFGLVLLFLIFGDSKLIDKLAVVGIGIVVCVVVWAVFRTAGEQYDSEQKARSELDNHIKQNNIKADYKYFFSGHGLFSGVAISNSDERIILVSDKTPMKLFHRDAVLSVKSLSEAERILESGRCTPKEMALVKRVEVFVKDLENPCYKLYFKDDELTRLWASRLTAWLSMHAPK